MKMFITVLCLSFSASLLAAPKNIKPCDATGLKLLTNSIAGAQKDGYTNVKIMKNTAGKTLGFFSWGKEGSVIKSEICEYLESDDLTVANEWYYWDSEFKPNPAKWQINNVYLMSQDEGTATMKLLKSSATGDVTVQLTVQGMGDEDLVDVRQDIVTFSNK